MILIPPLHVPLPSSSSSLKPSSSSSSRDCRSIPFLGLVRRCIIVFVVVFVVLTATTTTTTTTSIVTTGAFVTTSITSSVSRSSKIRGPLLGLWRRHRHTNRSLLSSSSSMNMSMASSSSHHRRLESPSAERNKEAIWEVLSSKVFPSLEIQKQKQKQKQQQSEGDDDDDQITPILKILEIAAGTGVHTEYFASQLLQLQLQSYSDSGSGSDFSSSSSPNPNPPFLWYPTDPTEEARESIRSRINGNVNDIDNNDNSLNKVIAQPMAVTLDASGICKPSKANFPPFASAKLDLILCINMIHISPWEATLGLMKLAGTRLIISSRSEEDDDDTDNNDDGGYLYCYGPYKEDGKVVPSNENFDASLKSRNPEWGVRNLKDVIKAANDEGLELVHCISMPANNASLIFRRKRSQ